jgi:hypothetical protein
MTFNHKTKTQTLKIDPEDVGAAKLHLLPCVVLLLLLTL